MYLQAVAIFCLAIVQHSLCYEKMDTSNDPIRQFLQLDADSQHELVEIELFERLHKRAFSGKSMPAGTRLRVRAFGDNVDLWLHPKVSTLATDETPVYYSEYAPDKPGNVSIVKQLGLKSMVGRIFEDPEHLASMVLGKDNHGRVTVNGQIRSKSLVVRSLPEKVVNEYLRKRRSIDDSDDDFSNSPRHVVYRIDDDFEKNHPLVAFKKTLIRERVARTTSEIPSIIYPKILVVVDHSIYDAQGSDLNGLFEYILAFWNGVDLKYRELENPEVRLHISAILVGTDPNAIPFISKNWLVNGAFAIDSANVDSTKFFYDIKDSIPLGTYDVALTTTRYAFGLFADASIRGRAFRGSVCGDATDKGRMMAAAMVRDNGAFAAVHTAAHELGHVLGLTHDVGQVDDCVYTNGFIMSGIQKFTSNSSSFSICSLEELQKQFDNQNFECMYEKPQSNGGMLPKLMPGRIKSLEDQCATHRLGLPCNVSTVDVCVNVHCLEYNGNCLNTRIAALEGTRCSDESEEIERFCVHSQCVSV